MKNFDSIFTLAKKFIAINSTADNYDKCEKILDIALSELKKYKVVKFKKENVKSVLIYNKEVNPQKFKVILNAHLDIVPGKPNQYNPKIENGRLYGVGAMDMKTNAACMIHVFKDIASKVNYPLGLQLVTDEEVGGFKGTKYQIERGIRSEFVIAGESTQLNIANQSKGILWLKIHFKGKSAHGAYPWKGINANWEMVNFLKKLEIKYPHIISENWSTTINLSKIETDNNSFNKIPDKSTVYLDIRYIPSDREKIIPSILSILSSKSALEIVFNEPPTYTNENNIFIKTLKKSGYDILGREIKLYNAHGSSDIRHFTGVGGDGVEFGAVGGGIGSHNEWVDLKSVEKYYNILANFLLSL